MPNLPQLQSAFPPPPSYFPIFKDGTLDPPQMPTEDFFCFGDLPVSVITEIPEPDPSIPSDLAKKKERIFLEFSLLIDATVAFDSERVEQISNSIKSLLLDCIGQLNRLRSIEAVCSTVALIRDRIAAKQQLLEQLQRATETPQSKSGQQQAHAPTFEEQVKKFIS